MGQQWSMCGVLLVVASVLCACTFESIAPDGGFDGGHMDAGRDAATPAMDARIDGNPVKWIASKTTLDVWWPGVSPVWSTASSFHDPGRGNIALYALTRVTGACDDANSETTIKVCGIVLPPFTSDLYCNAYQLSFPDAAWDSRNMPRFAARTLDDVDAGGMIVRAASALIGIELSDDDATWPAADVTATFACGDGAGLACFPDHDGDSLPGVTALAQTDAASYVGPYGDGRCTQNGREYRFRGLPTALPNYELGGAALAHRIGLGVRMREEMTDCAVGTDTSVAGRFDMRAIQCSVDPSSLDPFDWVEHRDETMDYACTPDEARFVDEMLPQYRVLARGQRPGETLPLNGWRLVDRDIDRTPSEGTRVQSITLDVDDLDAGGDGEPSCAQVRAVFAND